MNCEGKMKISIYFVIYLLMILSGSNIYSQELPVLTEIDVRVTIELDGGQGFYFYNYSVKNGETSNSSITRFTIDVSDNMKNSKSDTLGLKFRRSFDRF
jgi:hypothetical protein